MSHNIQYIRSSLFIRHYYLSISCYLFSVVWILTHIIAFTREEFAVVILHLTDIWDGRCTDNCCHKFGIIIRSLWPYYWERVYCVRYIRHLWRLWRYGLLHKIHWNNSPCPVSRFQSRFLSGLGPVRSKVCPCGICGGRSDIGTSFLSEYFGFLLPCIIAPVLHALSFVYHRLYVVSHNWTCHSIKHLSLHFSPLTFHISNRSVCKMEHVFWYRSISINH